MAVAIFTSFTAIIDSNGLPVNGARINVYSAGTTTPLQLYSDSSLSTPASNPIVCNSAGRHAIRYISPAAYKVAVTDADGVALTDWSLDNIDPGVPIGSGALAVSNGGTGATTAAVARTNLGAASSASVTALASDVATLQATDAAYSTFVSGGARGAIRYKGASGEAWLSPGNAGEVLVTGGAGADPSWGLRGAEVFLSSVTASNSAQIDFTSINSTYQWYRLFVENLVPATDNVLLHFRVSTDGGTSFAATSYLSNTNYAYGASVGSVAGTTSLLLSAGNGNEIDSAANYGWSGIIEIMPLGSAGRKHLMARGGYFANGGQYVNITSAGVWDGGNTAINAVRLVMSSGNIASGTVRLYGVRGS